MLTQDDFKKYPSIIEDEYKTTLKRFCEKNPEYQNLPFCAQEKIDGTNVQLNVMPDGEMVWGSRKKLLLDGIDHFGLKKAFADPEFYAEYFEWFERIKEFAKWLGKKVTVFGEWFGPKICKKIDYGDKRRFMWFDIAINDTILPLGEVNRNLNKVFTGRFMVPMLAYVKGLNEILKIKNGFISLLSKAGHIAEGIVIKPYYKLIVNNAGDPFFIKKKDKRHLEVDGSKLLLGSYVTENRIDNIMSKEGMIQSKKNMNKYLKLIQTDIINDFNKANPDTNLSYNKVSEIAKMIIPLLKKYL